MAAIYGTYKDKGRSLELRTSIVKDIRVRDYPVASTARISFNPNNEAYCDIGEWVQLNGSDQIDRPSLDANGAALGITHSTLSGTDNCVTRPALVWYERGGTDVQAVQKVPVINQGVIEMKTYLWTAETSVVAGAELAVMYIDGSNAHFAAADVGFTGIKGGLTPMATVLNGAVAHGCHAAALQNVWVVGIALEAGVAGSPLLCQIHSTPFIRTVTVA